MNELKNLLVLKSQTPLSQEAAALVEEVLRPLLQSTNSELVITSNGDDVELHPSADVVKRLDRLCDGIEHLVEVNQALLAYMINLDGVDAPIAGGSLDE